MKAVITEEVVQSMKQNFLLGYNMKEACEIEDISVSTWRHYEERHPDIRRKRKRWQAALEKQSKAILAKKVYEDKDADMAMYFVELAMRKETKKAANEVNRATAAKLRAEAKRIKAETAQINGEAGALKESTTIIDDIGAIEHAKDKNVKDD